MERSERFRINDSLARIGDLTTRALDRQSFVDAVLNEMLRMGFERARFWEVVHDALRDTDVVVLSARQPTNGGAPVGYSIDWSESDFANHATNPSPSVAEVAARKSVLSQIQRDLDLAGRVRIAIPVTAGSKIESIIACDWRGSASELSKSDVNALRLVGAQVGSYLALKPIIALEESRGDRPDDPSVDPTELVCRAAQALSDAVDAGVTSVFAFSWAHQELTKIHEIVAPEFRAAAKRAGPLAEVYPAGGPPLTGAAWRDANLSHIISYESVKQYAPNLVPRRTVTWLTDVLGNVRTILYATAGSLDRRYLIRLINRVHQPELPFLREMTIVETFMSDLRSEVDASIANQRLRSLEQISGVTAESGDPDAIVANIGTSLRHELVNDFVAICHQHDSPQFSFARFFGPSCGGLDFPLSSRWNDDSLYASAIKEGLTVLALSEYPAGRSRIAPLLAGRGFRGVLALPMQAGQTVGVFFVPMKVVTPRAKSRKRALPEDLGYGTTALVHAYSRLLANAVELMHSQERVRGARRALGLMGHEVRHPVAALGSAGESAIVLALRTIDQFSEHEDYARVRDSLFQSHSDLLVAQRRVGSILRLSRLIARESEDTLRLQFSERNLAEVVRTAAADVDRELRGDVHRWRHYFTLRDSARQLGSLVFDEDYVGEVFKNVLLNAVKYSLPRRPPPPGGTPVVEVEIIGEPQRSWVGVKIRNWGWGIPDDLRDVIFQPWARGFVEEDVEALSGMGLGLFLARRLIAAHGGEVLVFSEPTGEEYTPRRRPHGTPGRMRPPNVNKVQIHETVFEVRLPRGLRPGLHTHRWSENQDL